MKTQTIYSHQPLFSPPYKLDIESGSSSVFYYLIDSLSEVVENEGKSKFNFIVGKYRKSSDNQLDSLQFSEEENILDILIIGVLWNVYNGKWGNAINVKRFIFNKLYQVRSNSATLKPLADKIRGKLSPMLDQPNKENCMFTLDNLIKLTAWLSATTDFNEEVKRIEKWITFLEKQPKSLTNIFLQHIEKFASWFEMVAYNVLHDYTRGVAPFLKNQKQMYQGAEDYFFTGRKEVEYHLNMVGAAIMNRSMSRDFLLSKQKILLLPSCMAKNEKCQSVEVFGGQVCTHCTKGCSVSNADTEMKSRGVNVFIIKHSSSFSKYLSQWKDQAEVGLIGTACTLNLLMGGYEMKRLNIPAQCVFLNFPGCKKHWKTGNSTSISIEQVDKLIGYNHPSEIKDNKQVFYKIA